MSCSNIFQVISTLVESGLSPTEENKEHLNIVAEYLEKHFHQQNGVLGFGIPQTIPHD